MRSMKAKSFGEEQIIAVLREAEAGAKAKELFRRHGISDATPGWAPQEQSLGRVPGGR